jgi:hypothetical protein
MGDLGRKAGEDYGNAANLGLGRTGSKIGDTAERIMGDAGGRGGSAFKKILYSEFADGAIQASRAFTLVFASGNILGTGIAALVSSLSAAVSGLFAMASAASVAAGSLAVLPGLMSVAAQAAGTLKLAFSGVGAALKAGLVPAAAATSAAGSATTAQMYAVRDASTAVQRATEDLRQAQVDATSAQNALNSAREAAAESLQQLGFSAEEAAISEERAALNLEDAHKALLAVQNLPPDNRARIEAELAFKEAELNYRQAKDRNNDLEKEQKRASKAGIKGSDEVLSAKEKIAAAEQTVIDKQQALIDARERLRRAQEALNTAQNEGSTAANAFSTAMDNLSKPAQTFVKYLISIKDAFDGVKSSAGEELFPKLQESLEAILNGKLLERLQSNLKVTGDLLGDAALGISSVFETGATNRLGELLKGNNEILEVFTERGENGSNTFSKLMRIFIRLGIAIQPVTETFAKWIDKLVDGAEKSTRTKEQMDELTKFFNKAGRRAALLGDIFGNLFGILKNLGKAADPAGKSLLKSFEKATAKLEKFTSSEEGQKKLKKFFRDVAENLRDIGDLVVVIGETFLGLGDNKGIGEFAKSLEPAVENFGLIGDQMTSASPSLGEFITKLSELAVVFADTGGIETFFSVLNTALSPLVAFAKSDFGKKILIFAGGIAAFTRAISFVIFIGKKVAGVLTGGLFGAFRKIVKPAKGAENSLRGVGRGSDAVKLAFERQMKTDQAKINMLRKVEVQADRTALALERTKIAGAPGAVGAAGAAGKAAGQPRVIAPGAGRVPTGAAGGCGDRDPEGGQAREDRKSRLEGCQWPGQGLRCPQYGPARCLGSCRAHPRRDRTADRRARKALLRQPRVQEVHRRHRRKAQGARRLVQGHLEQVRRPVHGRALQADQREDARDQQVLL